MSVRTRQRGRPCGLTPHKEKVILAAIRRGLSYKRAAALAGISYMTFNRWKTEGQYDDAPQVLRDFCDHLETAIAENANSLLGIITKAAVQKLDWKAAAWLLERRYPDEWGKREPVGNVMDDFKRMTEER